MRRLPRAAAEVVRGKVIIVQLLHFLDFLEEALLVAAMEDYSLACFATDLLLKRPVCMPCHHSICPAQSLDSFVNLLDRFLFLLEGLQLHLLMRRYDRVPPAQRRHRSGSRLR